MKNHATKILQQVFQSRYKIFLAHTVYSVVGMLALFPLVGVTTRLLLSLSGKPALTNQDILYSLLTPIGVASFLIIAILVAFIVTFEQASLMTIANDALHHQHRTVINTLLQSARQAPRILSFSYGLVVRLVILIAPFLLLAGTIGWSLLTEFDINFYLAERPPRFWWAVILIGAVLCLLLGVLIRKLLDWSMSLPLLLFTSITPAECFSKSKQLMRSRQRPLLFIIFVWSIATLALSLTLGAIIHVLGSLLLLFAADSIELLVLMLGALIALSFLGSLLITAITAGSFAFVISDFFTTLSPSKANAQIDPTYVKNQSPRNNRLTPKKLIQLFIICASISGLGGLWLLHDVQVNDSTVVIAHRGASGSTPENTLAAVNQAIIDGSDWIEIDVQETKDGEIVVIHDSDFMKLAGASLKIWDGTLQQIQEIDVGSHFHSKFANERVPTLENVLKVAKGKTQVLIELKYYGHDEQLEERVINIIERLNMAEQVMLMSLSYNGIQKVRSLRPSWKVGLLAAKAVGNLAKLDVDFLAVSQGIVTALLVRDAQQSNIDLFVWTINDSVNMSRMISLGVDGIITDEPRLANKVLKERSELSTAERFLLHTALFIGRPIPQTTEQ